MRRALRARWRLLAAVALLLTSACGAAADQAAPASPTGGTPTAGRMVPPAASDWVVTPRVEEAVVEPAYDESFVNPGGVAYHDGAFHMLRNSFTTFPGPSSTTYLTSDDGIDWQEAADAPVLTTADVPYADDDTIVFVMSLVADGDAWVAYLYTFDGELNPGVIGRATASDPAGPWAVDPEPVLAPGTQDAWDERRVAEPSVVRTADGWRMLYAGFDADRVARIGLATSDDGVLWERADAPVLEGAGDWDGGAIGGPNVVEDDDGGLLLMYDNAVRGQYGLGVARSDDGGATWAPAPDNPQLTADDIADPQFFQTELVRGPDGLHLLLEAGSGRSSTRVYSYALAE